MRALVMTFRSRNRKTDDMVQTWMILRDIHPALAVQTGLDSWICLDCKYRNGNGCYVSLRPVIQVWRAYHAGRYPTVRPETAAELCRDRAVRLGSYAEVIVAPYETVAPIVRYASKWTGYTHGWQYCDRRWRQLLMASCDTPLEYAKAQADGWRAFIAGPSVNQKPASAILCPASAEAGHRTTCASCGLCSGLGVPVKLQAAGPLRRRRDVYISLHGSLKSRALSRIAAAWRTL